MARELDVTGVATLLSLFQGRQGREESWRFTTVPPSASVGATAARFAQVAPTLSVEARRAGFRNEEEFPVRRATLVSVAILALAAPGAQAAEAQASCATGSAAEATVALYGSGSELGGTETIASLRTALALDPRMTPATRRRMVDAGDRWCDATSGFNRAWAGSDRREMATAYARMAAAPYFDEVTVTSVRRDYRSRADGHPCRGA